MSLREVKLCFITVKVQGFSTLIYLKNNYLYKERQQIKLYNN